MGNWTTDDRVTALRVELRHVGEELLGCADRLEQCHERTNDESPSELDAEIFALERTRVALRRALRMLTTPNTGGAHP